MSAVESESQRARAARGAPRREASLEAADPSVPADPVPADPVPVVPTTTNTAPAGQQTLLVVDDDPVGAELQCRALERAGYRCLVAHDAEAAWKLLSREVALVLLDVVMPEQNGPEILGRMRHDPTLADIPVIFVTGRADAATRIQCLAMGAADFVVKPFRVSQLVSQVHQALERPRHDELGDEDSADPLEAALEGDPTARSGADPERLAGEVARMQPADVLRHLLAERRATRRLLDGHRRLVSALFRLHQAMSADRSLEELGQSIVALTQKALQASEATLWIAKGGCLRALAPQAPDGAAELPLDGPALPSRAWHEWLTLESPPDSSGAIELHLPLTVATDRVGVLSLRSPAGQRPSDSLAGFFCAEVALALDWSMRLGRAETEAQTDPLTGVYNRRFLEAHLAEEIRRASASGLALSLLFMDIDRFKSLNDSLGHEAGDRVLRAVAARIAGELRGIDVVARMGGDEFVVLLPGTDRAGSRVVAERIHAAMARSALEGAPELASLGLTIGAATWPEDGRRPAELIASADAAMLRGKRAGRGRIELFGSGPEPAPPGRDPATG